MLDFQFPPPLPQSLPRTFQEIWLVDFEFQADHGERPVPVCLVAVEVYTSRKLCLWQDQFGKLPPYSLSRDSLFVAYFASAELGCQLALNWQMPSWILDLFTEFRCLTNGMEPPAGNTLIGALTYFGLDSIAVTEKKEMRDLILRGGPWTETEKSAILDYCESDVDALARLLPVMRPRIDLPRALLRGRYMAASARMEYSGVPIDTVRLEKLRSGWESIQDSLIAAVDEQYGIFEGRTFKMALFEAWLARNRMSWPRLESGQLDLRNKTFREMAKVYPPVAPLHELRHSLSEMRLDELKVGKDGRNRCLLSPFQSKTGRNQPSNTKYIFGPSGGGRLGPKTCRWTFSSSPGW